MIDRRAAAPGFTRSTSRERRERREPPPRRPLLRELPHREEHDAELEPLGRVRVEAVRQRGGERGADAEVAPAGIGGQDDVERGDRLAGPRALVENVRDGRSADGAAGMNPIELCWSKLKGLLREFGARTRDALDVAIQCAMDLIDRHDAAGWFRHGYQVG